MAQQLESRTSLPLLLTRPTADSAELAATLQKLHIPTLISPVLRIAPLAHVLPDAATPIDGVILTSRHAVYASSPYSHLPLYAVGEHTAAAAEKQGFTRIIHHPFAQDLLPHIPSQGRYLYLSGEDISCDFALHLPQATVTRAIVYCAHPHPPREDALQAVASARLSGIVFYSSRSASLFAGFMQQSQLLTEAQHIPAYCYSEAIAEHCRQLGWQHAIGAPRPETASMLALLTEHK